MAADPELADILRQLQGDDDDMTEVSQSASKSKMRGLAEALDTAESARVSRYSGQCEGTSQCYTVLYTLLYTLLYTVLYTLLYTVLYYTLLYTVFYTLLYTAIYKCDCLVFKCLLVSCYFSFYMFFCWFAAKCLCII